MASLARRWRGERAPRDALLYVGIPAYFGLTALMVRELLVASHPVAVIVAAMADIGVFTVIFLWLALGFHPAGTEGKTVAAIAGLLILAAVLIPLGGLAIPFLIAASAMATADLRPPAGMLVLVLATAGIATMGLVNDFRLQDVLVGCVVAIMIILLTFSLARQEETNRQLKDARRELAELAVVNERLRFARDMHDLLGHTLTVIRAKSELAGRLLSAEPARAGREVAEIESDARQALADVRQAVTGYRRTNLATEVVNARAALEAAGITPDVARIDVDLPPSVDDTLGWVLREAVTNVVRHSRAARCRIETACENGRVRLEVVDDGSGGTADGSSGSGLAGASERLAAVGGSLHVSSPPGGGGFRVTATVPRPV